MADMRTPSVNNCSAPFIRNKIALTVAAALTGFVFQAVAAETTASAPKNDTITVIGDSASNVAPESAWGPAPTIVAKHSATGTKTDTPIVKTPQSISVVTREEMDTRQPTTVKEALNYAPGVFASRGSSSTYDAVAIRGFTSVNTNQYLDGIKLQGDNYSEVSMDPYFLERVELLRGPSSVLYGKSNPGGVITMVSKRPTIEPLREIQFKMGSDSLYQTGFDFSDAIDDDGVYSYRLTGVAHSQNTQQVMAKEKRYAIAPSFSWRPDDKTNFTFLSNFQDDPDSGFYGWLPRQGTVVPFYDANGKPHKLSTDFNDGDGNSRLSRDQKMVGYSFDHQFNDTWTVRQNLRYTKIDSKYTGIYDTGYVAPAQISRGYVVSSEKLNNFDVDTQAQAKFSTAAVDHTLLMGVDYMRMSNSIDADYGSANNLSLTNPDYNNSDAKGGFLYNVLNRQEQTGLYVQDQAEWNHWILTTGARYDIAKTSTLTRSSNTTAAIKDHHITWRGGLNYLFDNGISPYFSYSESFEPTPGASATFQPFKPSIGKQYEAGLKYIPDDRPISLTAAVYQLTKDNNLTVDPANINFSVQSGVIRSRGVELEAKAAVNANINVIASYTFTDAKYTHDTNYQGQRPVEVPRNMASLWADYTFHESALSGLTVGSGVRYVGATSSFYTTGEDNNKPFNVASYALVDALVKYDLARVGLPGSSVGVNINNLFNREYVASCYRDYACYWGTDRQIVATATFRF
ncbi:ferrichrome porin FhuA [Rouxiella silvae]|uniref:Ferrichrome porin FhuA n=1 Tax=Rouxiella silvae TaxID=1646373 RepID=A0AA40X5N7_9GAMM|nr:ferrichrome porin FhuA [Rouxiella silvae]MBF6638980.1 ferrichrome porin FhuA [Rouxiella silvae]ORJ21289.1 ferrichrome porin FhuA [Rouxiella silvae]